MPDEPTDRANRIAADLRAKGHHEAAARISTAASAPQRGGGLLEALREACQSVLTAVEAIDPSSYAAIEELRLDLDRRLDTGHTSG